MISKQYHFRPSNNGFYAWDVQKLIVLAATLEPKQIPLKEISEIDEAYWFGAPGDVATCRIIASHAKQIEKADLKYPIIICPNGRIMDGMHRVLKALNLEMDTITAYVLEYIPEPDFVDILPDELKT